MKVFIFALLGTALLVSGVRGDSTKTISVYGTATKQVMPDMATISIAVVTQNKDALVAQQDNATKSGSVLQAVQGVHDPAMQVNAGQYSIEVQHPLEGAVRQTEIIGYEVTNRIVVKVHDLTKVGTVIDQATRAGANSVSNVTFGLDDDTLVRQEALTEATSNAMARAQAIARGLTNDSARLIQLRPLNVREAGIENPPEPRMGRVMALAAAPTPIEAGKLDITVTVILKAEVE
jgi:uncharacterized protein